MSTTIKRIALVAVAALGLGVTASVPSNAAPTFTYTVIGDADAGQALIGGQAVVSLLVDTATSTIVSVSGVGSVVSTAGDVSGTNNVVKIGSSLVQWTDSSTVNVATANTQTAQTITLYSAVAGVTTITATPLLADGSPGTAKTKTVTWVSALAKNSVNSSLAYIKKDASIVSTSSIEVADSTTAELSFSAALNAGSPVKKAAIWIKQFSANDTTTVSTVASGKGADIKVEISGAGTLGNSSNAIGSVITTLGTTIGGSDAANVYYVYSDGRSGTATITITSGTTVFTKTVKFTGTAVAYKASADEDDAQNKLQIGVGETATVGIDSFDSLNNRVAENVTLTATSETATVATISSITDGHYIITGVKEGNARFKLTDGTYSTYVSIAVTKKTIASYKVEFDKTSYAPGEKVTWTITATDANGKPVADGARALFGSVASNLSVSNGSLFGTSPEFVDGVATGSFYAPAAASGKFEVTVSQGAADDVRIAALAAATAAGLAAPTAVKTVYGFDIVNAAADAATEAANDAAQAASDATDAALAAADAADEATSKAQEAVDAVATLSAEVSKMITALKAQIKTLSNLVTKIAKKVRA